MIKLMERNNNNIVVAVLIALAMALSFSLSLRVALSVQQANAQSTYPTCNVSSFSSGWFDAAKSSAGASGSTAVSTDPNNSATIVACNAQFTSIGYPTNTILVWSNPTVTNAYVGSNNFSQPGTSGLWYSNYTGSTPPGIYLQFIDDNGAVLAGIDYDSAAAASEGRGQTYQLTSFDGISGYNNFTTGLTVLNPPTDCCGPATDWSGDPIQTSTTNYIGNGSGSGGGGNDPVGNEIITAEQMQGMVQQIIDFIKLNTLATFLILGAVVGLGIFAYFMNGATKNGRVKV